MSLAALWVRSKTSIPQAQTDVIRKLDEAAATGVDATLVVGPGLTTDGRSYVGRWDGREFVVLELTKAHQQDWEVQHNALTIELDRKVGDLPGVVTERLVSLSGCLVDNPEGHDGSQPLTGTCIVEPESGVSGPIRNWALRARYYRPGLTRRVTAYWYAPRALFNATLAARFSFTPVFSADNPDTRQGLVVAYIQMYSADDWQRQAGCRRISNLTQATVTLR